MICWFSLTLPLRGFIMDEDFEWDAAKATANLLKHHIAFIDAQRVFDDPFAIFDSPTDWDQGEPRMSVIGAVNGVVAHHFGPESLQT